MLTYGMGYYSSDRYLQEARRSKINILPPDINKSGTGFTLEKGNIRTGLGKVKGMGEKYLESILSTRKKYKIFHSLHDFCYKINSFSISQFLIENLIKIGAFDFTTYPRSALLTLLPLTLREVKKKNKGGMQNILPEKKGFYHTELIASDAIPTYYFSKSFQMSLEKEILNLYITNYPLKKYDKILSNLPIMNSDQLLNYFHKKKVLIKGILIQVRRQFTRQKQVMAFLLLEDEAGFFEVITFPDTYQKYVSFLQREAPLLIEGTLSKIDGDSKIIARKISNIDSIKNIECIASN